MKKNLKVILGLLLSVSLIGLIGCSSNSNDSTPNNNSFNNTELNKDNEDSFNNTTPNKTDKARSGSASDSMSKQQYVTYLNDRYNYYFADSPLYNSADIYVDSFNYDGTNEDFIISYSNDYIDLKDKLVAFKNDLQNNVPKGDPDIEKENQSIITAIDKDIIAVDRFNENYASETKDFGSLAKDEFIKSMKALGRAPHDAKVELDKLVQDAKNTLGIK